MANNLLSLAGWTFLPELVTGYLQSFYYGMTIRAGDPKPRHGSPEFVKHRMRIYSLVILSYLLYTIYEADWEIQRAGNFYSDLGVPFDVDDRKLNSKFRRLTLEYHPDKIKDPTKSRQAEAYYVHLKLARDTLVEPARRWAYDRFGPDVTQWRHCVEISDYVFRGAQVIVPYYIGSTFIMIVMGFLGYFNWGKYWRYLALASLAVYEFSTITSPSHPYAPSLFPIPIPTTYLSHFLPPFLHNRYLPFQWLKILHKSILAFFIALERLGPALNAVRKMNEGDDSDEAMEQQLLRLERSANTLAAEVSRQNALEMAPFHPASPTIPRRRRRQRIGGDDESSGIVEEEVEEEEGAAGAQAEQEVQGGLLMRTLRTKIKDFLVLNTIRNNPTVQQAVQQVLAQRREEQQAAYARMHGMPS